MKFSPLTPAIHIQINKIGLVVMVVVIAILDIEENSGQLQQ